MSPLPRSGPVWSAKHSDPLLLLVVYDETDAQGCLHPDSANNRLIETSDTDDDV